MNRVVAMLLAAGLCLVPTFGLAKDIKGYTTKKGTKVQTYNRTSGNNWKSDNYSSKGVTNPYTGKRGTQKAY